MAVNVQQRIQLWFNGSYLGRRENSKNMEGGKERETASKTAKLKGLLLTSIFDQGISEQLLQISGACFQNRCQTRKWILKDRNLLAEWIPETQVFLKNNADLVFPFSHFFLYSPVSPPYTHVLACSCPPECLHLGEVCPSSSYPQEHGLFPESDPPWYTHTHTSTNTGVNILGNNDVAI